MVGVVFIIVAILAAVFLYPRGTTDTGAPAATIENDNGAASDTAPVAPDAALPDATAPDAATPDSAVPDAATPDAATPDAATPDAAAPADGATPVAPATPPAP